MPAVPEKVTCKKCGYRSRPPSGASSYLCSTCGEFNELPTRAMVTARTKQPAATRDSQPPKLEPVDELRDPPESPRRGWLSIALGLVVGVAVGALMAVLSPRIGLLPLVGALGVVSFGFASLVLILFSRVRSAAKEAEGTTTHGTSSTFVRFTGMSLAASWALLGVAALPSVSQFLKVATLPPPPIRRPPPPAPPSPWAKSEIVLVGSGGFAVGLRREADLDRMGYILHVAADKKTSGQSVAQARSAGRGFSTPTPGWSRRSRRRSWRGIRFPTIRPWKSPGSCSTHGPGPEPTWCSPARTEVPSVWPVSPPGAEKKLDMF